ncbi:MAG: 5-formyltetrahydrofolate cyclo-ligase [Gammaproteobacteria bacterium]
MRKEIRHLRRAISTQERSLAAEAAAKLFSQHPLFQRSHSIATYLGKPDEFDSVPIIEEIWREQKKCYLPVVLGPEEKVLDFMLFREGDSLRMNRYKILEPENTEKTTAENLDLVLMPLVAFDLKRNRLGMGGGYYDHTFEFILKKNPQKKPLLIGLAYANQQVDYLPHDPWDVPLDGVLTEEKFIIF